MITMNYQIQSNLLAYGQQLTEKCYQAYVKASKNMGPKDEIILSHESQKRLAAQRITYQIIRQFTEGSELGVTQREILSRLSRGYGQPFRVYKEEGQGRVFIVPEGKSPGEPRNSSPQEAEYLSKKPFEFTQVFVYYN